MADDALKTITVQAGDATYDALVGRGILAQIGHRLTRLISGPKCAIVSDTNTGARFATQVERSLEAAGYRPTTITFPAGENSKSLDQLGKLCDAMASAGLDRSSFVVALGGGVIGDLAGFAAAVYHRGIPYVQVPTTLLAQVDSAIGGKTAVNTAAGKNLLGAVHQPLVVIADIDTLGSLPPREFRQGLAEIIKHAIIADESLFTLLLEDFDLADLVRRNIEIKAAIVARDEHDDSGVRAVLNFGQTVGHAFERAAGYGAFLHGEAISLGIAAACEVSVRRAGLSAAERQRVITALQKFDLPTQLPPDFPRAAIMESVITDKKFARGEVRFVVTPRLGSARLTSDVTLDDIAAAVATL